MAIAKKTVSPKTFHGAFNDRESNKCSYVDCFKDAVKTKRLPRNPGKPSLNMFANEGSLEFFLFLVAFVVPDFFCGRNACSDEEIASALCGGVR